MRRTVVLVSILLLVVSSCGDATGTSTVPPDSGLELVVAPTEFFPVVPGQLFMVLATVPGDGPPVEVSASATGAAAVEPKLVVVDPGAVSEFTLVASPSDVDTEIEFELTARRGDAVAVGSMEIAVVEWEDTIRPLATELRDRFVAHVESTMPELGITSETDWIPSITRPQILVVMHYLFFCEDWEMGIMWHVTVPENAWSRMYLRPRTEMAPTVGLEIPSYLDPASVPVPWDPPAEIDR